MKYKRGDIVDFSVSCQNKKVYQGKITETAQKRCHISVEKEDGKQLAKERKFEIAIGYENLIPRKIKLS